MQPGHKLKFWTPGGSSTPLLTAEHLDVPLDFEGVAAAGSILGTTATQIFSDQDCPVYATYRWMEFYHHESCGKCTPCREGNYWMVRILPPDPGRPGHPRGPGHPAGHLRQHPRPLVLRLGDGATSPVTSSIKYFKQDYLDYIEGRKAPTMSPAELVGVRP